MMSSFSIFTDALAVTHRLVWREGYWRWLVLPVLVQIALLSLLLIVGMETASVLLEWALSPWEAWFEARLPQWFYQVLTFLLAVLFKILIFGFYLAMYKYLLLILLSPYWSFLSESIESYLTGRKMPFSASDWIRQTLRGIYVALRNAVKEFFAILLLFVASGFPVIGLVVPVLGFGVQAYFFGFSMMDYYFERQSLTLKESTALIWKNRWVAIGIGGFFLILTAIPSVISAFLASIWWYVISILFFIPVVLLTLGPIYCVIAGTVAGMRIHPASKTIVS